MNDFWKDFASQDCQHDYSEWAEVRLWPVQRHGRAMQRGPLVRLKQTTCDSARRCRQQSTQDSAVTLDSLFLLRSIGQNPRWTMPSLEFLRSEIEHMRSQIGRQRKEILQLQRAGISTASAEALLSRMQAKVEGLCTERDRLANEEKARRPTYASGKSMPSYRRLREPSRPGLEWRARLPVRSR
ncbi:hypothetical protein ACVIIW_001896 [Bradyrhizobium sp. USDA 4449]